MTKRHTRSTVVSVFGFISLLKVNNHNIQQIIRAPLLRNWVVFLVVSSHLIPFCTHPMVVHFCMPGRIHLTFTEISVLLLRITVTRAFVFEITVI